MFRRLGRADGVDVGNLSEKEGEMMVAAGKGKAWDHGPESLVTLNLFINQAIAGYEAKKDTLMLHDQQQWGSWDNLIYGAEE